LSNPIDMSHAAAVAVAAAEGKPAPKRVPRPRFEPKLRTLKQLLASSAERALGRKPSRGLTTGHYLIDRITGGLKPDDVWLIGADTNVGKSCECVALADENLLAVKRVLIVTSEDGEERYAMRLMCRRARCDAYRYRDHELNDAERARVQAIADAALPIPVYLDARGVTAEETAAQIFYTVREHGIHLVLCDYLQAWRSEHHYQDRPREVGTCARVLIDAMKRSGAAGVLFSQLTIESRTVKPTVHHVRDCKDPGQFSETAMFLYELEKGITDKNGKLLAKAGDIAAHLDKVKDGERGKVVPLDFHAETVSFRRVDHPREIPVEAYDDDDDAPAPDPLDDLPTEFGPDLYDDHPGGWHD
jgi:replicative DNA helicase